MAQPGEPLLTFGSVRDGKVEVTQKRFFLNPKDADDQAQSWVLPICMKSSADQPDCPILSANSQELRAPAHQFSMAMPAEGLLSQPLRQRRLSTAAAPG